MGTFDILNMRLNGYDFHIDLMAGTETWTDPRVKAVFETWRKLLPYFQEGALGRTWQEAAKPHWSTRKPACTSWAPSPPSRSPAEEHRRPRLLPVPGRSGTEFDDEMAIDAPIDGFMLSTRPQEPRGRQGVPRVRRPPEPRRSST